MRPASHGHSATDRRQYFENAVNGLIDGHGASGFFFNGASLGCECFGARQGLVDCSVHCVVFQTKPGSATNLINLGASNVVREAGSDVNRK